MKLCRRVYLNGDTVMEGRIDRDSPAPTLQGWPEYNRFTRPGCTLLVDGKVDTLGIMFNEIDRQRLEELYAGDRPKGA